MPEAIALALVDARCRLEDVDAVAYTRGPGMFACLSVCVSAGRALAAASGKPSIGVHHMQAHALTPLLTEPKPPDFPFLTLLVSGGHTLLLLAESPSRFEILANTLDDAAGNTLDRAARLLNLDQGPTASPSLSPGAALEAFSTVASNCLSPGTPTLPRPVTSPSAFSFSGIGSAFARALKKLSDAEEGSRKLLAGALLEAVFDHLAQKTRWWLDELEQERGMPVKAVVASGGVASNRVLRGRLASMLSRRTKRPTSTSLPRLIFPPVALCTDNAAMISWVGLMKLERGLVTPWSAPARAKWSIEECEDLDAALR